MSDSIPRISSINVDCHTNGMVTNGAVTNGVGNGFANRASTNGASSPPSKDLVPGPNPRILTWSSADEDGITRFAEPWKQYFSNKTSTSGSETYLNDLVYTLNRRRSRLPWTTYALVDETTKLTDVVKAWTLPVRRKGTQNIAFVFSGVNTRHHHNV